MIRVAITEPAFEAIPATLPLGSVGVEPQADAKGDRWVWLEGPAINSFRAMRGHGEGYCDFILWLIETAGHDA